MPKVGLFNKGGQQAGDTQLDEQVSEVGINKYALHQIVVAQLANKGQGTRSAKTRSEVRGDRAKLWRQKGTGRTKQGSIGASQWIGGEVVFASEPRDYRMSIPKGMRKVVMTSALTSRAIDMVVLEDLTFKAPKTKEAVKMLNAFEAKKILIITTEVSGGVYKPVRNIGGVTAMSVNNINVYNLLNCKTLMITKEAANKIEGVYA